MPGMRRVGARLYTPKQSYTRGVARHARRWNEQQGAIMATHAVTSQDFNQVVESNDLVFVDFWATWCGPCKKEMPAMKALEAEYKDNKDIVFMGISVDASKNIQKWKDFVIKEQLPGVQLFGGDMAGPTLSKPYKITGIPRFMLVGKDGSLIYMDAPRPSSSEIRAVLNDALKK